MDTIQIDFSIFVLKRDPVWLTTLEAYIMFVYF